MKWKKEERKIDRAGAKEGEKKKKGRTSRSVRAFKKIILEPYSKLCIYFNKNFSGLAYTQN